MSSVAGVLSAGTISAFTKRNQTVVAIKQMPKVSRKAARQPQAPGQVFTKAETTMGPTIPATAPIVLPETDVYNKNYTN